jgi:hypothetical protein
MSRHRFVAFGVAVMILLAACASPSAPSSPGAATTVPSSAGVPSSAAATAPATEIAGASPATNPGDPCRLLTAAEAEAALGRAVRPPVTTDISSADLGTGFDCAYNSVNQDAGPASVHAALLSDRVPRATWEQAARQETGLEEVTGVGELAFFDKYGQKIDAFDHGRWVQVQMINSTRPSELLALLSEMARNAIARI